jgi:hypothetical protein
MDLPVGWLDLLGGAGQYVFDEWRKAYVAAGCGSRSSTAASRRLQASAESQSADFPR